MKNTILRIGLCIWIGLLFSCQVESTKNEDFDDYGMLKSGFIDPTGSARPKAYWWWLNGYTDTVRIKEELQTIKNAGLGGVDIFEIGAPVYANPGEMIPAGPAYMSDESLNTIVFAIREATNLGLEVDLNLSSSWNAGGSWIPPAHSAKSLYRSAIQVKGGQVQEIQLPFPEIPTEDGRGRPLLIELDDKGKPVYHEEVAVLAVPENRETGFLDTAAILDLTPFFDQVTEVLHWDVPEGDWKIYRFVCSNSGESLKLPSPNSMGPIIDHFDSAATEFHFMYFIDKLKPLLGDFRETALKSFYLASFEATGNVWTASLANEFLRIHGYEIHKYLPYFFDKELFDPATSERFKKDFDRTISELMIHNHYRKGSKIAREHGLQLISESGGPGPPLHNVPVESIKALGSLDVPRGEFWVNHRRMADSIDLLMVVKGVSAAANTYQRKIAELEAFTSFQNWQEGPGDIKPIGDRAFAEGMNRPVIHGFTHNPSGTGYPGIVYHAGTHYNDKRVWWPKVKPFNDYLSRISYLLQETDFFADVLYYYGDKVPNFAVPKNTRFAVGSGYDYEIVNTEILLNDLTVKDNKLQLANGAVFQVLSVEEVTGNIPGVIAKLRELAQKGAIITFPDLENLPDELRQEVLLVNENDFTRDILTQGEILGGVSSLRILKELSIEPDFDYPDKGSDRLDYQEAGAPLLEYSHYGKEGMDFYFIRNTTDEWATRQVSFRQSGKTPELWHPETGSISPIPIFDQGQQQVSIPLTFAPYESYFIVFANNPMETPFTGVKTDDRHPPRIQYLPDGIDFPDEGEFELFSSKSNGIIKNEIKEIKVDGPWKVDFAEGWGAPETADFPTLISWTESEEEGIRYYSGTATYYNTFQLTEEIVSQEDIRAYLDLGQVEEVAEVWLNDKRLGITWTLPHRFDVTDAIQQGENKLKIEVANSWSNRIVGDAKTGEKFTSTNLSVNSSQGVPWAETPLIPSGLLGPVNIQWMNIYP